jgi:uncharacterized protein
MVSSNHFPLNQPFKPAPSLVTWLLTDFILFFLLVMSFTVFPVFLVSGSEPVVLVIIGIIIIVPVVAFVAWVRLYFRSMWYELRDDEMSWKRGVWFRTTGVVPYNRITNIDVRQGPIMRALGISTLSVQTAGYSGQAVPEIRIEGIEQAEELRELIRSLVRQPGTNGDGTGGAPARTQTGALTVDQKILDELVRIRQLLETQRK